MLRMNGSGRLFPSILIITTISFKAAFSRYANVRISRSPSGDSGSINTNPCRGTLVVIIPPCSYEIVFSATQSIYIMERLRTPINFAKFSKISGSRFFWRKNLMGDPSSQVKSGLSAWKNVSYGEIGRRYGFCFYHCWDLDRDRWGCQPGFKAAKTQ